MISHLTVPNNKLRRLDSSSVSLSKIVKDSSPLVILFFNPECNHCEDEIKIICERMPSLAHIQFIFVTNRPPFMVKPFVKKLKLANHKNITTLVDMSNSMIRYYGISNFPSMIIYDRNKRARVKYNSMSVPPSIILKDAM